MKSAPEKTIIKTDDGNKQGKIKCPKCGATDISVNTKDGKLRCNYCRYEFLQEKMNDLVEDISKLSGEIFGSGATNIIEDVNSVVTFKCDSCGAEVVVDTNEAPQARCHWCRHKLSVNQQIPNGAFPDVLLPFTTSKDEAIQKISDFIKKRKTFAHPTFKKEFSIKNVMGVYLPYMIVDTNLHSRLDGEAEKTTRTYTNGIGDNKKTYYDVDVYKVGRDFDLLVNDLSIESSSDKLNKNNINTNNVINSIMPFDTENCVKYDSNYLTGFTSEKRDINIEELKPIVFNQLKDVAKFSANESVKIYDRGVRWDSNNIDIKGQQWVSAYLPIWLYSYQQVNKNKKIIHYVALNARTREIMGSIPIHFPKLFLYSLFVEIFSVFSWRVLIVIIDWDALFLLFLTGPIYFIWNYFKYRNSDARHKYESETKTTISNMKTYDKFHDSKKGIRENKMNGANNMSINKENESNSIVFKNGMEKLLNNDNIITKIIKNNLK